MDSAKERGEDEEKRSHRVELLSEYRKCSFGTALIKTEKDQEELQENTN